MKKRTYLILLVAFFLVIIMIKSFSGDLVIGKTLTEETVTGKIITGDATQGVGMNITMTVDFPVLSITSPKNQTYLVNESILLNYSTPNAEIIWYNLDGLNNITITSPMNFNASEGNRVINLYANASNENLTAKNVSFFINSTRFIIYDDEYNEEARNGTNIRVNKKVQSIDFLNYTYEELQNLSNVVLDNTEDGRIRFNQAVNLTDDENPDDNTLNLDSHTNISFNRIEINSSALPNFNKSATLWLHNLTFPNPRILRDGSVCPSSICTQESYTGGALKTLKFNVTGFSVYTAEETPSDAVTETPSGGGGGGGSSTAQRDFYIEEKIIEIMVKQGESFKTSVNVKNTEKITQDFQILLSPSLEGLVFLSNNSFSLKAGEGKIVYLTFVSTDEITPDIYTGNLQIKTSQKTKKIPIIFNVKSKIVLFDISLHIPTDYKEVFPGEEVMLQLTLFNLGDVERADVSIEYSIKDFEGNIIDEQSEVVAIETQAFFYKIKKLPLDVKPGQYVAIARARYDDSLGSSSDVFYVVERERDIVSLIKNKYFIMLMLIFVLVIFIVVLLKYELKKIIKLVKKQSRAPKKISRKISGRKTLPDVAFKFKDKFGRQLEALEKAYSSKYISKKSYLRSKERISKAGK